MYTPVSAVGMLLQYCLLHLVVNCSGSLSVQVLLCINKNSLDDLLLKLYIKYVTSAVQIIIFALLFVSFLCGQYAIMWNCTKMLDYFWVQNIPKCTKHCVDFL